MPLTTRADAPSRLVRPPRREAAHLTSAAAWALIDASLFLNQSKGLAFNVHVTIHYGGLGLSDHSRCAALLSRFNHETGKWLARQGKVYDRPYEHHFLYVHENARDHGFHTHQLMWLPPALGRYYRQWARTCLARLSRLGEIPNTAIMVKLSRCRDAYSQGAMQGRWVRYLLKSTASCLSIDDDGEPIELHDLLGLKAHPGGSVMCAQRCGVSRNIGPATRDAHAELPLRPDKAADLFSDWSLNLYHQRAHNAALQQELERLDRADGFSLL